MMKSIYFCITLLLSTIIASNPVMAGYAGTHDSQPNRTEKLLFKAIGAAVVGAGALAYKEHKAKGKSLASEMDSAREDNKSECPVNAPHGPYYRYETNIKYVIQARKTELIYGKAINKVGITPYVKAYKNRHTEMNPLKKSLELIFCTNAIGFDAGGGYFYWPYGNEGVYQHDDETVKIQIKVLN